MSTDAERSARREVILWDMLPLSDLDRANCESQFDVWGFSLKVLKLSEAYDMMVR